MILLTVGFIWVGFISWLLWRDRQNVWNGRAPDLLAGGLLFGLIAGFFWRTLSGDVYQPADGGDLVSFLFPTYRFAAAQLHQGSLPLWNPTLYGGAPFIGDIQAGFLYIPNLILFWLWPTFDYRFLQWLAIGHLYWAALGMYVLLRCWRGSPTKPALSRSAAFFGAVAFSLSDPLLLHLGNLNLIAVLSWLPWVLVAYHLALYRHSLRWAAIAGFLFSFANFAGHAQSTFYLGMVLGIYTIGYWLLKAGEWRANYAIHSITLPRVIAVLQYPLITATLTILLTAPILLPALELARLTERESFTYQDTVAFSLAPTQAIGLLTPSFFGRGPALHWGLWSRVETPYAGVATLILAIAALLLATPALRRWLWIWVAIALVGFTTALGIYALVHGWLTYLLPVFEQFRAPARALVLWTFALSVLSAFGVDAIRHQLSMITPKDATRNDTTRGDVSSGDLQSERLFYQIVRWGAVGLVGIAVPLIYFALLLTQENETVFLRVSVAAIALTLASAFWLSTWALIAMRRASWISSLVVALLLIGVLFFDLSATGAYTDISPTAPTAGYEHAELVDFLRNTPSVGRIDTLTDIQDLWQPDSAALYGFEDVGGIANPLMLAQWHQLWEALGGRQSRLYDMLNVTHLIVRDGTPLPEGKFTLVFDAPGALAVYHNEDALPRAWLVHDALLVDSSAAALAALQAPDFDPRSYAIVQSTAGMPDQMAPATGEEAVQVIGQEINTLTVAVEATSPGLLVLSELWYPGWRATRDGVAVPLLRTNAALRGVSIPAGKSTVELRFTPDSWRVGLLAAVAGWILLLIVFIFAKNTKSPTEAHKVA